MVFIKYIPNGHLRWLGVGADNWLRNHVHGAPWPVAARSVAADALIRGDKSNHTMYCKCVEKYTRFSSFCCACGASLAPSSADASPAERNNKPCHASLKPFARVCSRRPRPTHKWPVSGVHARSCAAWHGCIAAPSGCLCHLEQSMDCLVVRPRVPQVARQVRNQQTV